MNRIVLYILSCCSVGLSARAQPTRADSLYGLMQRQPADTGTVTACYLYGDLFYPEQPDSAAYYFKKGLALSRQLHYPWAPPSSPLTTLTY